VPGILQPNAGSTLQPATRPDSMATTCWNGQKCGPSLVGWAIGGELGGAHDANVPKAQSLTVLLIDLKSPVVEVRPCVK